MIHNLAAPSQFLRFSGKILPFLALATGLTLALGLYYALFSSPPDYQQGEAVRIMYVHVPAAWMSLAVYALIGGCSASFLIWRHVLADVIAREAAPLGACFTLICLITGTPLAGHTPQAYFWAILMAVGAQIIGQASISYALAHLPPTFISIVIQLSVLISAALALLLFQEVPQALQIAAVWSSFSGCCA